MSINKDRYFISLEADGRKRDQMQRDLISELMQFIPYLPAHGRLVAQTTLE